MNVPCSPHFIGYGSTSFNHLYFECRRDIDQNLIQQLQSTFRSQGCRRDAETSVPVVATVTHSLPDLPRDFQAENLPKVLQKLICLHGKHRLYAAKKYLKEEEELWWPIAIYSPGTGSSRWK